MSRPKSRKIDGKSFQWKGWAGSKTKAKERAEEFRDKGYKVRVIRTKPTKKFTRVYDIYARKK